MAFSEVCTLPEPALETEDPEGDFVVTPESVRAAYIEERERFESRLSRGAVKPYRSSPRWDGGRDKYGRRYKPVWPAVAQKLTAAGIKDPREYLRWVFSHSKASQAPYPNMVASPALIERFRDSRNSHEDETDLRVAYEAQRNLFQRQVLGLLDASYARKWRL